MTNPTQKLGALSALAALSRAAVQARTPKITANNAVNPGSKAAAALMSLATLLGSKQIEVLQTEVNCIADNTDVFSIEDVQSIEINVVINGKTHNVFSL